MKSFHGGKYKLGDTIHIERNKFGFGKDEIWKCEWDDSVGKFQAYNQLNSVRDFELDPEGELVVYVAENYKFYPKKFI